MIRGEGEHDLRGLVAGVHRALLATDHRQDAAETPPPDFRRRLHILHSPPTEHGADGADSVVGGALVEIGLLLDESEKLLVGEVVAMRLPDSHREGGQLLLCQLRNLDLERLRTYSPDALAEVPDVGQVRDEDQQREEQEGGRALPNLDHTWGEHLHHEDEPHVCEDREGCSYTKDGQILDVPDLTLGDGRNTNGRDAQEVESGTAHDRGGPQIAGHHLRRKEGKLDDAEQDLWRARAEGHEREVGDGVVPHLHRHHAPGDLAGDPPLLRGDALDGPHEDVGDDGDAHEEPCEASKVQNGT
mmetsp:Transcript_40422/g.116833  ORF Transcript_40422/g.116833 Transcript_40422/m.116833 type:complete len:301 (-) Transcript_40422:164-1066(-)